MAEGCLEFSLTVEQLEQKKLKRKQAVSHGHIIIVSIFILFVLGDLPN